VGGQYEPEEYWSKRLERDFNLRGTGHIAYSERYNAWLYRRKARALRRALEGDRRGTRALDAGSGVGWVVAELLRVGARVEGFDIAELAVDRLRIDFPEANFFRLTLGAEPIPRPNQSYDVITAMDVLYHITDDVSWTNAVEELGRVLRFGGKLIVSDGLGATDETVAEHVRLRSRERWNHAASRAGLELTALDPLYRWLSRPQRSLLSRLPDGLRGALEYGLEYGLPRRPHMRCAVFCRRR
jgi:SAM-dependent methyltransferase